MIGQGLLTLVSPDHSMKDDPDWRQTLFFTLVEAVDRHPLAKRLLAGLEPDVTERVLEIPALSELRKACADRMRQEQLTGVIRPDIDPDVIGNGVVTIILSLLMSVVQLGDQHGCRIRPRRCRRVRRRRSRPIRPRHPRLTSSFLHRSIRRHLPSETLTVMPSTPTPDGVRSRSNVR